MTRFKKEMKQKRWKFSEDYPCLPYEEGNVFIEDIDCNEEKAYIFKGTNVACIKIYIGRNGEVERDEWL